MSPSPSSSRPRERPRLLVGVSTKMYFSAATTTAYVSSFLSQLSHSPEHHNAVDVFIIPDFIMLGSVINQLHGTKIMAGAQDCHWEDSGAFTGEVSPAVLAEVGTRIVELGHAERRRLFFEVDSDVARKAASVARHGMIPLVCFGESVSMALDPAVAECRRQIERCLDGVPDDAEIILAYEPVSAIGAAAPADPAHVSEVVRHIRECDVIRRRTGVTRFLYGGSAGPGLFEKLKQQFDGLFLGRFAHDSADFLKTIEEMAASNLSNGEPPERTRSVESQS